MPSLSLAAKPWGKEGGAGRCRRVHWVQFEVRVTLILTWDEQCCAIRQAGVTCLLSAAIGSAFAIGGATAHGGRVSNRIQGQVW